MERQIKIEQMYSVNDHVEELTNLLVKVVDEDASIGFLPPLSTSVAREYWECLLTPGVILWVAKIDNQIAGSIQLHLCNKQNGTHRAEIAKLMTHPNFRRKGVARILMKTAEERAQLEGRSLLVLDTREGDPSNLLYTSLGYIQVGRIPQFAKSASGELDATILYYKNLS